MALSSGLIVGILLLLLFVVAVLVMGILLATENGIFCGMPESELLSVDAGTMRVIYDTSLYPYNGTWDSKQVGKTVAECMSICLNDSNCQAFHRHNEDGLPIDAGTCFFYNRNNVESMLGTGVVVDPYFTQGKMVVGHQLPLYSTDVLLKTNTAYTVFRSAFDAPILA